MFSMVKTSQLQSSFLSLHYYVLLAFKGVKLAFCFIHLKIRSNKQRNVYVNVCWQNFAIWFVPLEIQASEESFEKFNETGSNIVFNTLRVYGLKPTLFNSVLRSA